MIHCATEAPYDVLPAAWSLKIERVRCFATVVCCIYVRLPFIATVRFFLSGLTPFIDPHQIPSTEKNSSGQNKGSSEGFTD
jgi:hypothetical protein